MPPRTLPDRPDLEQLRKQAKDLRQERVARGESVRLGEAQRELARDYGFETWAALKARVESADLEAQLKLAIDTDDIPAVRRLLTAHPELHRARMGYGGDGPLTWAAECRGMPEPTPRRLEMVEVMIELGADVHQGGDGPLLRSSLGHRLPMAELLLRHGADVNARWHGRYPVLLGPCETLDPVTLRFLLERGADPDARGDDYGYALDMAVGTYARSPAQHECVELLVQAGARGKTRGLPSLSIHRGRLDLLARDLGHDPELVHRRFPEMDYGTTGGRRLDLRGATLLHAAAEYGEKEAARLLIERGADADARATVGADGVGGQTPIFHAVTQYEGHGLEVAALLVEQGADLALRCRVPGHYEDPNDTHLVTPLGYAARYPFGRGRNPAVDLLLRHDAPAGDVYAAARTGRAGELAALFDAGADPEDGGPEGEPALRAAVLAGHEDTARLLARAGARIDLVTACHMGDAERVDALLKTDPAAIAQVHGERQWTPAFFAAAANRTEVMAVLDRHHASWTARDAPSRRTPLHVAAELGQLEAVQWLLGRGVRPDVRQWTGKTPLEVARAAGRTAVARVLEERGVTQ